MVFVVLLGNLKIASLELTVTRRSWEWVVFRRHTLFVGHQDGVQRVPNSPVAPSLVPTASRIVFDVWNSGGVEGFASKSASARVCRAASGRVSTNVLVGNLEFGPQRQESRRVSSSASLLQTDKIRFHGAHVALHWPAQARPDSSLARGGEQWSEMDHSQLTVCTAGRAEQQHLPYTQLPDCFCSVQEFLVGSDGLPQLFLSEHTHPPPGKLALSVFFFMSAMCDAVSVTLNPTSLM